MNIHSQTKVAALLDAYPQLEETFLKLSPVFSNLRNPVLRQTVAKVATLEHAAEMGGIPVDQLVKVLREAAGLDAK